RRLPVGECEFVDEALVRLCGHVGHIARDRDRIFGGVVADRTDASAAFRDKLSVTGSAAGQARIEETRTTAAGIEFGYDEILKLSCDWIQTVVDTPHACAGRGGATRGRRVGKAYRLIRAVIGQVPSQPAQIRGGWIRCRFVDLPNFAVGK